jgi:hypothetical protein
MRDGGHEGSCKTLASASTSIEGAAIAAVLVERGFQHVSLAPASLAISCLEPGHLTGIWYLGNIQSESSQVECIICVEWVITYPGTSE